MVPLTFRKSLAFLMGFGVALLPSYGPFLGLLFFLGTRWSIRRADVLWLAAALIAGFSFGLHQGLQGVLFGGLQVLAPWLVYKAFREIRFGRLMFSRSRQIALGLLSGLFVVVALSWLQIEQLNLSYAKTIAQAIVWDSHPSLYGHTILVLGTLIAILFNDSRYRMASLGLAALGILMTGSREAAIGWVVVTGALMLIRYRRTQKAHLMEIGMVALMLAVSVGLGPALGWGRVGFLVDLMPAADGTPNLVQGSELPVGDWWDAMGVQVMAAPAAIGDEILTAYQVTKVAPEPWVRLQQVLPLQANTPYALSVWLQEDALVQPGVQGWGQAAREETPWVVTAALVGDAWRVGSTGPGQVLDSGILERREGWARVWIAFTYRGEHPTLYWHVGMAPDQRTGAGSSAQFAGFQVEQGSTPSDYTPGPATRGLGLGVARLPYWHAAWQDFLERPLSGWGPGSFPSHYERAWAQQGRMHHTPAHVHNLFLNTLFERGLAGFAALLLFLGALTQVAWRKRDLALLAVFAAVFIANLFDTTLFYSGVIYPLAAVAGWRAATYRQLATHRGDLSRQMVVGLVLPLADYLAGALAFLLAVASYNFFGGIFGLRQEVSVLELWAVAGYALLLWPAMFWREGLYPGYGLSAPQQLKRQVIGSLYAGITLIAVMLGFPDVLNLPNVILLQTTLLSIVLSPLGRAATKRLLFRYGLWGRPVIILGASKMGRQLAKTLTSQPLEGLHPIAIFDDDPARQQEIHFGIEVKGKLADANSYARRHDCKFAIATDPQLPKHLVDMLLKGKNSYFRELKFVPDLKTLPIYSIVASSLDGLLVLEVRNELNSQVNRVLKRGLDLFGAVVGGLAISPFLLILAVLIYIDSPGPVFFGHRRIGLNGRHFKTWKFRTMVPNAQELLDQYLQQHPNLRKEWEENHKLQDDPRITRIGKLLRKYSLDELPQLWNVLAGEMSLVGPRPIVDDEVPKYHNAFELYKLVRPGMTGYWQVRGRSDTDYNRRVELDSFYVRNWSVWLDIIVLVDTVHVVLKGDGAY